MHHCEIERTVDWCSGNNFMTTEDMVLCFHCHDSENLVEVEQSFMYRNLVHVIIGFTALSSVTGKS